MTPDRFLRAPPWAFALLSSARVGYLATADRAARPHVVPVVFAFDAGVVYCALDRKPKRSTNLRRLANLAENPRASLLVERYHEDWSKLCWVRADGPVELVHGGEGFDLAHELLRAKYPAYRDTPPLAANEGGVVIKLAAERVVAWQAATPG